MLLVYLALGISGAAAYLLDGSTQPTKCGRPYFQPHPRRIVGGQHAKAGSWPWMVALVENGEMECAGTILNEYTILTAANCLEGESLEPTRWRAVVAKHDLRHFDPYEKTLHIRKIIIHETYDNSTLVNDIALIMTQEAIVFNDYIKPMCLPPSGTNLAGHTCYATGWGDTQSHLLSDILNQVDLPIIDDATCKQDDWMGTDFFPGITLCAGYAQGGKDSCNGDGGAPLSCKVNSIWYVVGIVSWGYDCAQAQTPGIYTNVAAFTPWIKQHMQDEGHPYIWDDSPTNVG